MNKSPPKHVFKMEIFEDRLKHINKTLLLLNLLVELKDRFNKVNMKKELLGKLLGKNKRTISGWLSILSLNGAIKYLHGGEMIINPYFCFYGTEEDYETTKREWAKFRSVTPALKPEYTKPA